MMAIYRRIITIALLALVLIQVNSLKAQEQLARVGFLEFSNIVANENLSYLGGSISDALAKSMYVKFQYNRINNIQIQESFLDIITVRKTTQKNIEEAVKTEFLPLQINELSVIAKEVNADILIFGQFEPVGNNEGVIITTRMYFTATNKIIDFEPAQHSIDGSLFGAIDIMANSVVTGIANILRESDTVANSTTVHKEIPKVDKSSADYLKEEKMILTKANIEKSAEKVNISAPVVLVKKNEVSLIGASMANPVLSRNPPTDTILLSAILGLHYARYLDNKGLFALRFSLVLAQYGVYGYSTGDSKNSIYHYSDLYPLQGRISFSIQPFAGFIADLGILVGPFFESSNTLTTVNGVQDSSLDTISDHPVFAYGATLAIGYNFLLWDWLILRPMIGIDALIGYNIWPWFSLTAGVKF